MYISADQYKTLTHKLDTILNILQDLCQNEQDESDGGTTESDLSQDSDQLEEDLPLEKFKSL